MTYEEMREDLRHKKFAIEIAGAIGAGKTTLSHLVSAEFDANCFEEQVKGNRVLPLYYKASPEDQEKYRYSFLLQLAFLNSRFQTIKAAQKVDRSVKDRTIWEDKYFAAINNTNGRISDLEFSIYKDLLNNMMEEIKGMPQKHPQLTIYLRSSFERTINNIQKRGRPFEQGSELVDYYKQVWSGYDKVMEDYRASPVLWLDIDKYDVRDNPADRRKVFETIADGIETVLD